MLDQGVLITAVVVPCVAALAYALRVVATRPRRFSDNDIAVIDARILAEVARVIAIQRTVVAEVLTRNDHRRAIEVLDEAEAETKAKALFLAQQLARR